MVFSKLILAMHPNIEKTLKTASIKEDAEIYISKKSNISFVFALIFTILGTLIILAGISLKNWPSASMIAIPFLFILSFFFFINVFLIAPKSIIKKRKVELESDLLYSARFLLLKIESGSPLLNALIDVSNLHTKSSKYFADIVADIYLGTPIEEAIEWSRKYSPSKAFQKILEEIRNSLKTGADIERSLKATLDEMTRSHVILIKEYGKKLSPISMFYMIIGTILPALGSAMLVIALGFIQLDITFTVFIFLLVGLASVQIFFIMFFRAMKPPVMN